MQQTETRIVPLAIELPVGLWHTFDKVSEESGMPVSSYLHHTLMTGLQESLTRIVEMARLMKEMAEGL
jgi:hypothetical protein